MSDKIKVDELNKYFENYFNEYSDDIEDVVVEATDQITQDAKEELINTSPKSR